MENLLSEVMFYALSPVRVLLSAKSQYFWLTHFGAVLTTAIIYVLLRSGHKLSLRGLRAFVLPKRLFLHPSTRLDIKLFVLGSIYVFLQGALIFSAMPSILDMGLDGLAALFGPAMSGGTPNHGLTAVTVVLTFLALELGYWFSHWLMHRVDWLWEFHKVHHSAEVLTPLTEWRQHPVELFLFPALIAVVVATVHAPIIYFFGPDSQTLPLRGVNIILIVFWYTILHLRHTHIPITFTGFWGRILQSPMHHQVHHSTDPRYFNTNLGFCLSLWDWAFGTLYVPQKDERFVFGLGEQDRPLETAIGSIFAPFGRAARLLVTCFGKKPASVDGQEVDKGMRLTESNGET